MSRQKRKKGLSVQELLGIRGFGKYGLLTNWSEVVFFSVSPANLSVLPKAVVESKVHALSLVLSAIPQLEIITTDSAENFDANARFLAERTSCESQPVVRELLQADAAFLENMQTEIASSKQFLFLVPFRGLSDARIFESVCAVEKIVADQGFFVHRLKKHEIKRLLGLFFGTAIYGESLPDADGELYVESEVEHAQTR